MTTPNFIAQQITIADQDKGIQLDASVKRVLALKPILARILKGCVKEYADKSVTDIEYKYIEGLPSIANDPLHEDDIPPAVSGSNVEHKTQKEGTSTFDIKFNAIAPNGDDYLNFIINVEGQSSAEYSLIKRGFYYCGRMFSAQYGKVFTSPHYDKLRKVISIWICFDHNQDNVNTINKYTVKEESLVGKYKVPAINYNLIDVITIFLGSDKETDNALLKMLDKLFSKQYTIDEKLHYLENECNIPMTTTISKEVSEMCNYSAYIKSEGRIEGKIEMVENMLKNNEPVSKITAYSNLTMAQIQKIATQIGVSIVM